METIILILFQSIVDRVYLPSNTELREDTYHLEVTNLYSCAGRETSVLCVHVYDVAIDETITSDPLCQLDSAALALEPLHFLIPKKTRDILCTALPMLNNSEPEDIVMGILHLQYAIDPRMFPYIFDIFTYDKKEIAMFLYKHCNMVYPETITAVLATEPEALTTESVQPTTESVQPTSVSDLICLEVQNDTIVFPISFNFRNDVLNFSSISNLDYACHILHSPVQNEVSSSPEVGHESLALDSSHDPFGTLTAIESTSTVCISWSTTDASVEVTSLGNGEESDGQGEGDDEGGISGVNMQQVSKAIYYA